MQHQVTHTLKLDDLAAWLAEHGLDINQVVEATIAIERRPQYADRIGAWLDVTWFRLNEFGYRYADGDEVATGHSTIPLSSLPPLTPITQPDEQEEPGEGHPSDVMRPADKET
jgi:hypothetical protein